MVKEKAWEMDCFWWLSSVPDYLINWWSKVSACLVWHLERLWLICLAEGAKLHKHYPCNSAIIQKVPNQTGHYPTVSTVDLPCSRVVEKDDRDPASGVLYYKAVSSISQGLPMIDSNQSWTTWQLVGEMCTLWDSPCIKGTKVWGSSESFETEWHDLLQALRLSDVICFKL